MDKNGILLKAKEFYAQELELRSYLRRAFSAILADTDEDHPMKVDIPIMGDVFWAVPSLQLPHIKAIWQDPKEGWIIFAINREVGTDFDGMRTEDLIAILEEMPDNWEIKED